MKVCQDKSCGEETKRRVKCLNCGLLVCPWCSNHVHGLGERVPMQRPDRPIEVEHYAIYESGDWLLPLEDFLDKYDEDWLKIFRAEAVELREAAQALLDISKRDLTNPKYDDYFKSLKLALLRMGSL